MPQDTATIAMTYAELARRLSIKPSSAKRLAQRHKWHRVIGNDRIALVHVPREAVPSDVAPDVANDIPDDVALNLSPPVITPVTPDLAPRVAYLEGLLEGIREQLTAAEAKVADITAERDAWKRQAHERDTDLIADRDAWRRQAQRSLWSKLFGRDG